MNRLAGRDKLASVAGGSPVNWLTETEALPALFVGLFVGAPYLLLPLYIRSKMVFSPQNRFEAVWLGVIPPEAQQAFDVATRGLAGCGFRAVGHLRAAGQLAGGGVEDSHVSLWVNEREGDVANVMAVRARSAMGKTCDPVVAFGRQFTDGSSIATTNRSSATIFPADPTTDSITCCDCWDLEKLYAVHRARAARLQAGRRIAPLPRDGEAAAFMHADYIRDLDRVTRAGYYSFDSNRPGYRPTLKGAYIMTWRLLWPLKQSRPRERDRRADAALRELGFGGLTAFRASQKMPVPSTAGSAQPPAFSVIAPPPPLPPPPSVAAAHRDPVDQG
jgi:hypothetical protein